MIIPQVIERAPAGALISFDIFSRLLRDRIIFISDMEGVVTTASANILISQLLYLDQEDDGKPIFLYLNSPGGSCSAGLAIVDTMNYIKSDIHTIGMGQCASFGAVLLAAGTKGHRYILPKARVMIHQPLIMGGGISGQATDIEIEAAEMQVVKKELTQILADCTGKSYEQVLKDSDRNFYMSAEQAVEYGICDEVIKSIRGIKSKK